MEKVIIVTGHYGSGKTNLALNLALRACEAGEENVTLCDLDIVNPYFRTADFKGIASQKGIKLLASDYANSNLDVPALSGGLEPAVNGGGTVIVDVGGDDTGAMALGRYAQTIKAKPYTMLYVVNAYRNLTKCPADAARLLREIEKASRLTATHIVNCSNLGAETTADDVIKSRPHADEVAKLTGKTILFTAADRRITEGLNGFKNLFSVGVYVKPPWDLEYVNQHE